MALSHTALAVACQDYLTSATPRTHDRFFRLALEFAYQQAGFHLRFHSTGLWARTELVDDLASYSLEMLLKEFSKPGLKTHVWLENPLGCLKTFFHSRAISFFRKEGNYQFKYANTWSFDGPDKESA